jgi:hypothetical protein
MPCISPERLSRIGRTRRKSQGGAVTLKRCIGLWVIGTAVAGISAVAEGVLAPEMASAVPCDGVGCADHVRTGAVEGASCEAMRIYPFGVDGNGNAMICLASYRHPRTNTWTRVPRFDGMRFYGEACSDDQAVAQSPEGIPLRCTDSTWQQYIIGIPQG